MRLIFFQPAIPLKPRKAKDIIPAVTRAIAVPCIGLGTGEIRSRCLRLAKRISARENPSALAVEKTNISRKFRSCFIFNNAIPITAQLVVINGK